MSYRLEIKIGKGWKQGQTIHPTEEAANTHKAQFVKLGHPKKEIRVVPVEEGPNEH